MKKVLWVIPVVLLPSCFGFYQLAPAGEENSNPQSLESRYETQAEELEKTKEMTKIWKDHVKTLTRERDEAYQQIEALKAQAGSQSRVLGKGGVEIQPIPIQNPKPPTARPDENESQSSEAAREIKDLKYQMDRLRYDNEKLGLAEKEIESLKSQIESFRSESEKARLTQKEFETVKADKEKIAQAYSDLKNQSKSREKELQNLSSRVEELEKVNRELQGKRNAQLKAIENLKASFE